jgi:hypothetical protein
MQVHQHRQKSTEIKVEIIIAMLMNHLVFNNEHMKHQVRESKIKDKVVVLAAEVAVL